MIVGASGGVKASRAARAALCALLLLVLTGCMEQYQTTRTTGGSLQNFLLHLQHGELDDALTYFAPGMVEITPELKQSVKDASDRLRMYEIRSRKTSEKDLGSGRRQATISGEIRPATPEGRPTPGPTEGWVREDILTAQMVERGPGWRILDFQLLCCK